MSSRGTLRQSTEHTAETPPAAPAIWLCPLLAAAWVSCDAALWDYARLRQAVWPQWPAVCGLGLVFGQAALASLWLVGSRRRFAVRAFVAAGALYLLATMAAALAGEARHADRWLVLMGGCAAMSTAALGFAALGGWRVKPAVPRRAQPSALGAGQFSVAGLLSLMTTTAVCLGALHWLRPPAKPFGSLALFCGAVAVLSLAALAPLACARWRFWSVLPPLLAHPAMALVLAGSGVPPAGLAPLVVMVSVQTISIVGSVAILRIAGLAVVRAV